MKHLLRRAVSIFQNNGSLDLARAVRRFIVHGSLRDELLNTIPRTEYVLRWYIRLGHQLHPLRYTDADPFKIFWVDPDEIVYDIYHTNIPLRFGRVYGGSWDQTDKRFTDRQVYQCFEKHFKQGIAWEDTTYYQNKRRKLEQGRSTRGCTTIEELTEYFGQFDRLYNTIEQEGYKTQEELLRLDPKETTVKNLDAPTPKLNEVGICIGRNGKLFRGYRGEHRLAIAKLIGVNEIPVQVIVRHKEWQQKRLTQTGGVLNNSVAHPDLQD